MPIKDVANAIRHGREVMDEYYSLLARNESATRYAIIDPIIWGLGWLTCHPTECRAEYARGLQGNVDYALLNRDGKPVILIEAKRLDTDVSEVEWQLAKYGRGMRKGVGVLTDGQMWHLYDFGVRGKFEDKHIATVDIYSDGIQPSARKLNDLLSKAKWW